VNSEWLSEPIAGVAAEYTIVPGGGNDWDDAPGDAATTRHTPMTVAAVNRMSTDLRAFSAHVQHGGTLS
jgi:hypothetical protein